MQEVFQQFLRDTVIQETRKMPGPEEEAEDTENPLVGEVNKPLTVSDIPGMAVQWNLSHEG